MKKFSPPQMKEVSFPTPHTLHPTPHTLHPTPHTPHPTPYTPLKKLRQSIARIDGRGFGLG
jgi:DNA gyrase subunit A